MTKKQIVNELKKMWGENWETVLEIVANDRDAYDKFPKGYITKSNGLVQSLWRCK